MEKKKIMMKGTIFQLLWGHLKNNRQAQASGCGTGSLNTPKFGAVSGFKNSEVWMCLDLGFLFLSKELRDTETKTTTA